MKRIIVCYLFIVIIVGIAVAKVRLPAFIGSNMVLQRNSLVNIWGHCDPMLEVSVTPSWNNLSYKTFADKTGKWQIKVETPEAGGPYTIRISDGEELILENIMLGDVWICSGQSNMEMTIHGNRGEHTEESISTLLGVAKYPHIRLFNMQVVSAASPQEDCPGSWEMPTVESVSNFSAVAYHFGCTLSDVADIPVGLISTNWGASSIQAWISRESLEKLEKELHVKFESKPEMMKQKIPGALYNGMIHPVTYYSAKGFIWYQGEGNRHEYRYYDKMMAEMVNLWRTRWGNMSMPFYFVELAPHKNANANDIDRPLLVEAQHRAHKMIPYSGIAGTSDIGDYYTIHPPRKREVGIRLALITLANDYGIKGIEVTGPVFCEADYGDDGVVLVSFDHAPYGFRAERDLSGFELAGADRKFYSAKAIIIPGKNQVKISCDSVPVPVAVRYAFRNWCVGNLYNTSGIPAAPFRTDSWDDIK